MSSTSLMNQTVTIYSRSSYNAQGREVVGSGTNARARVQPKSRNVFAPNSQLLTIVAVAYVPATTTVEVDDKVVYGGQNLKVYSKYPVADGEGNTDHIKLELIKWQTA